MSPGESVKEAGKAIWDVTAVPVRKEERQRRRRKCRRALKKNTPQSDQTIIGHTLKERADTSKGVQGDGGANGKRRNNNGGN